MTLTLTNTLSGQRETFVPADPDHVTLYVCGPTVYNYAHVGNARPAVVFDVLYRVLKRSYPRVTYARNFTDIDDKINAAAEEAGKPISAITGTYIKAYHEDMAALGVLAPDIEPRVTDHVTDIIEMIKALIDNEHAYAAEGHVLFDVFSFEDYGKLSGRSVDEMRAGARVEVAPFKRDAADFVLWKPSSDDQPGWDSPWGRGRPGWHIECSAMIGQHLGKSIDIHGGGQDLIFPHHENEIAQGSCAWPGTEYCRYWMHNGFVTIDGAKMSKSLGNVQLVRELLEKVPGEAIRFALLSAHYRSPLDLSERSLNDARRGLDRLYGAIRELTKVEPTDEGDHLEPFYAALEDDLNTPAALAELFGLAKSAFKASNPEDRAAIKAAMIEAGGLLGLLDADPEEWFTGANDNHPDIAKIEQLVADREAARSARDFAEADRLRNVLGEMGIHLDDSADGTSWRRTA
ncbi:MAG: cysteine--tRNA ligase [Erythrobacter sp.]|uniref:cysteine--tRNA ligase n=1 Tax=Erythrobacter sp. TaxID=1042 RepID=UPI00260ED6CE|nr:cysteine--tRNA ligase [Erythrobacter sp.]MDJ0977271.1 cysteine--tRNA ligase [Erythrobacter sp.]